MYSVLAFTLTILELGAVLAAFFLRLNILFADLLIYGSPLYMLENIGSYGSMLQEKNTVYAALLAFHLIKYFTLYQAHHKNEESVVRGLAFLCEAIYLALSAYYLVYLGERSPVFS